MKRYLLCALLVAAFTPLAAFCEQGGPAGEAEQQLRDAELQLELRNVELEIAQREAEVKFQEEMRNLELEKHRLEIEMARRQLGRHFPKKECGPLLLVILVLHILVPIWIYRDIQRRGSGSGIWIVIGLLAGLLGAAVYALVRLGDIREGGSTRTRRQ